MQKLRLLFFILPIVFLSCKTTERLPQYLEDVKTDTSGNLVKIPELRIQKNDLLSIQIYSLSTRSEADQLYNLPIVNATSGLPTGYLVDMNGNIEHSRLGLFHAEGLTKHELAAQIKQRLTEPVELLKDPTVVIRFMNFKVIVLGEVNTPGTITVPGERMTILEALGLSGDITQWGKRDEVRVAREVNGIREIGIIDLSSKELFTSPYYNLQQNDIVFVDPSRIKLRQRDQGIVAQQLTFALGIITSAAFLYNLFK